MKKGLISLIMVGAMAVVLVGCAKNDAKTTYEINKEVGKEEVVEEPVIEEAAEEDAILYDDMELLEGKYAVLIEVEDYGDIFVELDADAAPVSVTNFMKLVNEGFYDGLTFHRIIEGFMMQGGQSHDKQAANIIGEFAANGIENPISHVRGTISMARANDPNSANSQFFICHEDSQFLDGQYAAFGHVVSGMEVVDKICEEAIVVDDNGTVLPENQPVIKDILDTTAEYRADALGEAFYPSNELEAELGRDTFESYDEIISLLKPGMSYGYAEILGADEPVLIVNMSDVYDNEDGNKVAIDATPYIKKGDGSVYAGSVLVSEGTAYPISVLDGIIYTGGGHFVEGSCITNNVETPGIMNIFNLYEEYDDEGNVSYGGFIRDTNDVMQDGAEVAADDNKPLADAFSAYEKAEPVIFTVVE